MGNQFVSKSQSAFDQGVFPTVLAVNIGTATLVPNNTKQ